MPIDSLHLETTNHIHILEPITRQYSEKATLDWFMFAEILKIGNLILYHMNDNLKNNIVL